MTGQELYAWKMGLKEGWKNNEICTPNIKRDWKEEVGKVLYQLRNNRLTLRKNE